MGCHAKLSRIPLIVSGAAFRLEYFELLATHFAVSGSAMWVHVEPDPT
jgi:hypothetical protein